MNILHNLLEVIQAIVAIALVWIVMSQSNKDQGMGGAIGGSDAGGGGAHYKGGYEEKLDNTAKNLAYIFLGLSFLVAVVGKMVS